MLTTAVSLKFHPLSETGLTVVTSLEITGKHNSNDSCAPTYVVGLLMEKTMKSHNICQKVKPYKILDEL